MSHARINEICIFAWYILLLHAFSKKWKVVARPLTHWQKWVNIFPFLMVILSHGSCLVAKEVSGKEWKVKNVKVDDVTAKSDENIAKGIIDWPTLAPYLFRAIFDQNSVPKFGKLDNELVGIKGVTDEQVKELLKAKIQ